MKPQSASFLGCVNLRASADQKFGAVIFFNWSHSGEAREGEGNMRNLIHLGRTRIGSSLVGVGQDDLPITALAPIAHSESEFYVTRGPTASCAEVEVQRFQVKFSNEKADNRMEST